MIIITFTVLVLSVLYFFFTSGSDRVTFVVIDTAVMYTGWYMSFVLLFRPKWQMIKTILLNNNSCLRNRVTGKPRQGVGLHLH